MAYSLTFRPSELSQAYEILSDPEKRKTYDQFGLEFILRGGAPPPEGAEGFADAGNPFAGAGGGGFNFGGMPGGGAKTFHFSTGPGGGMGGSGFQFSNADNIFAEFMRSSGGARGGMDDDDDFGFSPFGGMPGGFPSGGRPSAKRSATGSRFNDRRPQTPEVTVVEKPLPVTLEELFNGTTKKMKIKRKTYDPATGKQSTQDRILEVPIKKGLKAGSKIKFSDVGDQVEGGTQDLHFIVSEVSRIHGVSDDVIANKFHRKSTPCSSAKATISTTKSTSISRRLSPAGDEPFKLSTASKWQWEDQARPHQRTRTASQAWACPRARSRRSAVTLSSASTSSSQPA